MISGHGDDSYNYKNRMVLNFSSNICSKIDNSALRRHLANRFLLENEGDKDLLNEYPEPEPYTLEAELARLKGVGRENVCVTNGATEGIYLVAQMFSGQKSVVLEPTFSEYADAAAMFGHMVERVAELPKKLGEDVRVFWLCNPNNPTGAVISEGEILDLIDENRHVCFIIDQSYEEFTSAKLLEDKEVVRRENVIVLHSLTKSCAIAGLRLGYATGCADLMNGLRSKRMPWSVNSVAIEAGLFLCRNRQVVDVESFIAEAQALKQTLESTRLVAVSDTETHFMLSKLKGGRAKDLKEFLMAKYGFLIRDASNFYGLDDSYFRVASLGRQENLSLVSAIECWFAQKKISL